ncbi:12409_t:CDS:2, partial [Dentiscutata heterogama]
MSSQPTILTVIHSLQSPIPQYVLGILPAITIIGTTPRESLKAILDNWVAEASLLDRLASLVSAYYILIGIFVGISKAAGPCMEDNSLEDWPFIPTLFIWTLPIIYLRIKNGKVVDRVSPELLINPIPVKDLSLDKLYNKKTHVAITALASVTLP